MNRSLVETQEIDKNNDVTEISTEILIDESGKLFTCLYILEVF